MAIGHEHQQPITVGVAALAGGCKQPLDLGLGQVFPAAIGRVLGATAILSSTRSHCRLFSCWRPKLDDWRHCNFSRACMVTIGIMLFLTIVAICRWLLVQLNGKLGTSHFQKS